MGGKICGAVEVVQSLARRAGRFSCRGILGAIRSLGSEAIAEIGADPLVAVAASHLEVVFGSDLQIL